MVTVIDYIVYTAITSSIIWLEGVSVGVAYLNLVCSPDSFCISARVLREEESQDQINLLSIGYPTLLSMVMGVYLPW